MGFGSLASWTPERPKLLELDLGECALASIQRLLECQVWKPKRLIVRNKSATGMPPARSKIVIQPGGISLSSRCSCVAGSQSGDMDGLRQPHHLQTRTMDYHNHHMWFLLQTKANTVGKLQAKMALVLDGTACEALQHLKATWRRDWKTFRLGIHWDKAAGSTAEALYLSQRVQVPNI